MAAIVMYILILGNGKPMEFHSLSDCRKYREQIIRSAPDQPKPGQCFRQATYPRHSSKTPS